MFMFGGLIFLVLCFDPSNIHFFFYVNSQFVSLAPVCDVFQVRLHIWTGNHFITC